MIRALSRPLAASALLIALAAPAAHGQKLDRVRAIEREFVRIADERPLWPGFAPRSIPLAIFTGEATYLFRHPSPPDGFTPVAESPGVSAYRGRHPAMTANSSADVGGVVTATLLADGERAARAPAALAAVGMHEAFHVHQRAAHPGWIANEGDLLLYPIDDARLLGDRRRESEALRRAVAAVNADSAACWAREALDARRARFARMDSAFVTYERRSELNEGLAAYVQMRAAGAPVDTIPPGGFAPEAVRARVYATGPALGALLDRFHPSWTVAMERDGGPAPDVMLDSALGTPARQCAWSEADRARLARDAGVAAAGVRAARTARRREFDEQPGWRVVIRAEGRTLFPQGFDPLNVAVVDGGLLHTRFLEVGNGKERVRILDEAGADLTTLTVGAGAHPLFNGVREVVIAGLSRPTVERRDGAVTLRAPGLSAEFSRATIAEEGSRIVISLAPER